MRTPHVDREISRRGPASTLVLALLHILVLSACGGGGGGEDDGGAGGGGGGGAGGGSNTSPGWATPPAPPEVAQGATVTGVFRDAVVEGLDYDDGGALSGTTGPDGRFQYAHGNFVSFHIGSIRIARYPGMPYMSPLHLPPTAKNRVQQVENGLRFLQMLDFDGNPENGILISEAVRAAAANWSAPDFSLSESEFTTAVQDIIESANLADGVTHELPSSASAVEHFARNAWCSYNGLYRGTYSGSGDNGVWTVVVYGNGGLMFGGAYSSVDREGTGIQKQTQSGLAPSPPFVAELENGASFSGTFDGPDVMRGEWTSGPDTGTFVGARSGGSNAAQYRISGYVFPLGTALLMNFEVDADGHITGSIIDRDFKGTAQPVTLTGTLDGTSFNAASAGNEYSIAGTFDREVPPSALRVTGTLRDNVKSRDINLNDSLPACRLN